MKKVIGIKIVSILTIIFFIGFLPKAQAQVQTCTVSGSTNGISGPLDLCGDGSTTKYAAYADLYLSTEICYATINAIQLYLEWMSYAPAYTFPVKIYMKTQAATTLTAGTYNNMLSGATLVYSASPTWIPVGQVPGLQTFQLQTSFTYTTGNLIIIFEQDYGTNDCGTSPVFGYGTKTAMDEYWYSPTSAANLLTKTGTVDQYRPGLDFSDITVVLPIELTNFTGQQLSTKNKLDWTTASETNNEFFTVERSPDGTNFTEITTVKGAGTSETTLNYSAFDEEPANGINYYRLKQTDYNGGFKYSDIISVTYHLSEKPVLNNIHPNPATDNVSFNLYSPAKATGNVQIVDITGRLISNQLQNISEGNQELSTSLNSLENGIYYLKVSIDELGYSHTAKIVKN